MHHSPLIIDLYFVKNVHFALKEGFDSDFNREMNSIEPPNLNINVESGKHTENSKQWKFELNINSDENQINDDFPYTFGISLIGFFRVNENYPSDKADLLAQVNAPSVLYSAAREFLSIVTGRSPYPAILLPSISFIPEPEKPKKRIVKKVPSKNPKTLKGKPKKKTDS